MSNGIEVNKIAGAVLLAGVIAMATGLIAEGLYKGSISEHHGEEAKRGYSIAVEETAASGDSGAKAEAPVDIAPFLLKADAAAGESFAKKKCTSCHTFDKGANNGVGPNQWNLVGGHIGHNPAYSYSKALQDMKDKKWGFQELSEFLASPKKFAPGNKMAFPGIADPQERANLIAYLRTMADNPVPMPK